MRFYARRLLRKMDRSTQLLRLDWATRNTLHPMLAIVNGAYNNSFSQTRMLQLQLNLTRRPSIVFDGKSFAAHLPINVTRHVQFGI
jgi:hypothetical protein